MKTKLKTLVEIQEVDLALQKLEAVKGDLPQRLQHLQEELDHLEQTVTRRREELTQTVLDRRHWEGEVRRLEELRAKSQDRLYSVTTNREYDAITLEIEEAQSSLSEAETRVIELMEREEQLGAEIEELEKQLESLRQDVATKREDLEQRIRQTEAEVRELTQRREELQAQIPRQMLSHYERVQRGRGNPAVVSVKRGACSGCFTLIPPQRQLELRQMDRLIFCEGCGRILVWTNGSE